MHFLIVVGTRPEAIKLSLLTAELKNLGQRVTVVSTGQHRQLIQSAGFALLDDLNPVSEGTSQGTAIQRLTAMIDKITPLIMESRPDTVVVQGDTLSAMAGALAARFSGFQVAHVEAGLRSKSAESPWPEELIRRTISKLSTIHFAPSILSKENLISEGISADCIYVTGNTSVDVAMRHMEQLGLNQKKWPEKFSFEGSHKVLGTLHRSESHGARRVRALHTIMRFLDSKPGLTFNLISHPNPFVLRDIEASQIRLHRSVRVLQPLTHSELIKELHGSLFAISDSGGLQEEGPTLGVPILIARDETERQEALVTKQNFLCKADLSALESQFQILISQGYPSESPNPYGRGDSSATIARILSMGDL